MTRSMKQVSVLVVIALVVIALTGVNHQVKGGGEMSAEDAAREMLEASGVEKQLIPVMKQMIRLQAQAMEEFGMEIDLEILDRWIDENISWVDFESGFIEIYTDLFTRDEMLQIAAFQRSPAGRKSIELMPVLMERGGQLGLRVATEKMPKLIEMLEAVDQSEWDEVEF